jgi:hypothetical protein
MITSLTATSLVHGSASPASLPVTVKIAAGGSWPVYPSILGWPRTPAASRYSDLAMSSSATHRATLAG